MDDGDGKLVKLEGRDEASTVIKCMTKKKQMSAVEVSGRFTSVCAASSLRRLAFQTNL